MIAIMASNAVVTGPTAERVAENVKRIRVARRLDQKEVSAKLKEIGRPMLPTVISKIERGERRIDVDDLVALALALNVSPAALLMPPSWGDDEVWLTLGFKVKTRTAWLWLEGRSPANDWGVDFAAEVEGAETEQAEEAYWSQRRDFNALTHPPERIRAAEHQANAVAGDVSAMVNRLVQMDQAGSKDAARKQVRITKNRLDRLRNAIEEIELELNGQDE